MSEDARHFCYSTKLEGKKNTGTRTDTNWKVYRHHLSRNELLAESSIDRPGVNLHLHW